MQLNLTLRSPEERFEEMRRYLSPIRLPARQVAVIAVIYAYGHGKIVNDHELREFTATVRKAAAKAGCGKTGFNEAAAELVEAGLIKVLDFTSPATYVLSVTRVKMLEPPARNTDHPLDDLVAEDWTPEQAFCPGLSGAVRGARDSVRSVHRQSPCSVTPCTRVRDTGAPGQPRTAARPWDRQGGMTDDELRRAVRQGDMQPLRDLWAEAIRLGWVDDSEQTIHRFLLLCHHVATSGGIHRPMAVLVSRLKRSQGGPLDVSNTRQASDDWAAERMRRRHRQHLDYQQAHA